MSIDAIKVGWFLAARQITRGSAWSTILIGAIMTLTFLNVVVVRGVLLGLPEGAITLYERQYAGQVIVTPLSSNRSIERSASVRAIIADTPGFVAMSERLSVGGSVEANYDRPRRGSELPDRVVADIAGIDAEAEQRITQLASYVVEGEYLAEGDRTGILIGSQLIDRYTFGPIVSNALEDVYPGSRVLVTLGENTREFTVRGIITSKVGEVDRRVYIDRTTMRGMLARTDGNVDEIAIKLVPGSDPSRFATALVSAGVGELAVVQTARESLGQFIDDIVATFDILSVLIGAIGLMVAAITIFIVIFINALSRSRQIGILKGIGISEFAIQCSYLFLSVFYAASGIVVGWLVVTFAIAPYLDQNPIDFPFSDGVLSVTTGDMLASASLIVVATVIAGFIPARRIIAKNTIAAILGR